MTPQESVAAARAARSAQASMKRFFGEGEAGAAAMRAMAGPTAQAQEKILLNVELQPKQRELQRLIKESPYRVLPFGGAKGGAKSGGIRRLILILLSEHPGTNALIIRKTSAEVIKNHVRKLFQEYPQLERFYNKNDGIMTLPNGSALHIGYGENEGDVGRYNGQEFEWIIVDQSEEFHEGDIALLKSCLRTTKPNIKPKLILTFNPGGISHAWNKRLFIDREFRDGESEEDFAPLLHAYSWDNVEWVRAELSRDNLTATDYYGWDEETRKTYFLQSEYGKNLLGLPADLRAKYLWGSFDLLEGAFFDKFNPAEHVYPNANTEGPKMMPWWPRWLSIDWGYAHNSAVYVHTFDGKTIWTYRELVVNKHEARELASVSADLVLHEEEFIRAIYLSHDAFAKRQSIRTIADEMGDVFAQRGLRRPTREDMDRKGGLRLMNQLMKQGEWLIHKSCTGLIAKLRMAQRDPKDDEDILEFHGDDEIHGARVGLKMWPRSPVMPIEVQIDEFVKPAIEAGDWITAQNRRLIAESRMKGEGMQALNGSRLHPNRRTAGRWKYSN